MNDKPAPSQSRICCILNERAGRGAPGLEKQVRTLFAGLGNSPDFLHPKYAQSITELAKHAVEQHYEIVVGGGGDGTISAVASALVGTETKLGVLPLGTLNHFARDLRIPLDLEEAIRTIVAGRLQAVDVGEVNGRIFLNNSSVGLYPSIVRLREGLQKHGYGKWRALIRATIAMLTSFRTLRLELKVKSRPLVRCRTAVLFVGNNTYDTTLSRLGTRAALDQGHLWAMMPAVSSRWRLIATAIALVFTGETPADIISFEAETLVVSSSHRRLRVATDGEVSQLRSPLRYRIRPKLLLVIVPEGGTAHSEPQGQRPA